ncbi:MAG TPA: N-acetyl-alpha-D-glucosaminyl L-malate synthase BshA [Ignavibacteriaceae bacterium]|nr:N-acetyl-alpha-D-glucosaminyl L-malate synthase BshA [Ignavibacteriaceae bacterium]
MKIGITCYPTYGGSGVVATELGKELAQKGHEVHFISYALPFRLNHFMENIFFHEVEMSSYPLFEFPLYSLALASKMVEVAKYENLDLLHVHYAIPHASSAFLAKEMLKGTKDLKVTTTLHGTDITLVGLEPSFLPLVKFSIEASDGVTAVSRFLKEKTLTNYDINKEIDVIPNFVNTELFRPREDDSFRKNLASKGEKLLIHTSNFRQVKRVQDTILILEKVVKEFPLVKLLLVGDGPERSDCERLSRELGLYDKVRFLGKQEALVDILAASDVFLIPSQSESFGLAALEAMSCGLPVVSSSVGGLPELIKHNESGFIAEFGDIDRMSKYVIELLCNDKKYEMFSQNARKRAVENFDTSKVIPLYEEHYKSILK